MNNKSFKLLIFLCASILFSVSSCKDDDTNEYFSSKEWRSYQEGVLNKVRNSSEYESKEANSGDDFIYFKTSDSISNTDYGAPRKIAIPSTRMADGKPGLSDTVIYRYYGWYEQISGNNYYFDSSEGTNRVKEGNGIAANHIDGFTSMLMNMKEKEEYEVSFSYLLGYGASGKYNNSTYALEIPPYVTMFFNIKLDSIMYADKHE